MKKIQTLKTATMKEYQNTKTKSKVEKVIKQPSYKTKNDEIERTMPDHVKYITTQESNKLTAEIMLKIKTSKISTKELNSILLKVSKN